MANDIDLDVLFPEVVRPISFTARRDGKKYSINLFIPAALMVMVQGKDETNLQFQQRLLSALMSNQHDHMTVDWIVENVPLQYQNYLYKAVTESIVRSSKLLGEEPEETMPEKKSGTGEP